MHNILYKFDINNFSILAKNPNEYINTYFKLYNNARMNFSIFHLQAVKKRRYLMSCANLVPLRFFPSENVPA